jgi:Fe-S-cluster-containing dehydrogenase component
MALDRRSALKVLATGAATACAAVAAPGKAHARPPKQAPDDAVGMLYDATLCIGCKACMVACRDANDVTYSDPNGMYYDPVDLSAEAKTVIKLYAEDGKQSFFKAQCMHCIDPACASACMLGAFKKRAGGVVTWDQDRCIGCRYCQVACPFGVPKFEWGSNTPRLVKCEMCSHRLEQGGIPACVEVCPRESIIFGDYRELLEEARRRLREHPERYYPKVYGETDGGGTQVLFLSPPGVPFEKVGLPDLGERSIPWLPETLQHTIYKGFVAPIALYSMLATVIWRNHRLEAAADQAATERDGEVSS